MSDFQNQATSPNKSAPLNLNSTEESILDEYRNNDKNYKVAMLSEIISVATKNLISNGEIDDFKKYLQFIIVILNYEKEENPKELKKIIKDATQIGNFIILACKYNRGDILTYLMDEKNQSYSSCCPPGDEDNVGHNAFNYALRKSSLDFLKTLLEKWPGYFNSKEMYFAFADALAESYLKMLTFPDEFIMFIIEWLVDYNFYTDQNEDTNITFSLSDLKERAKLLIENIRLFMAGYSNSDNLDGLLTLLAKFIVSNIDILKQQMKATYSKILWEEIEFYIVMYISSKQQTDYGNMNLYKFLMPKSKFLNYLDLFANIIENEMNNISDLDSLKNYPRESRVKMIPKILKSNPKIREFFEDYQRVKDVYGLVYISSSVQTSIMSYSNSTCRQLVIKRTLQIIAEMIKYNWESPNMTRSLSSLLLMSLPLRTRQIIINIHNTSFIHTQTRKLGKGNPNDPHEEAISKDILNDLKMLKWVTQSILHVTLIYYVTELLKTMKEMKTTEDLSNYIKSLEINFGQDWFIDYNVEETWNFDTLTTEFCNLIQPLTAAELMTCQYLESKSELPGINAKERFKHTDNLIYIKNMCLHVHKTIIHSYMLQKMQTEALFALKNTWDESEWTVGPMSIGSHILSSVYSSSSRLTYSQWERMISLTIRIFIVVGHGLHNYTWLETFSTFIWTKRYSIILNLDDNINSTQEKKELTAQVLNEYNSKVEILKNIIGNHKDKQSVDKFKNLTMQLSLEILLLELMSILDASKNLVDNYLLFDNPAFILVGKFLYNFLSRLLFTFQIFDSHALLFFNATKLCLIGDEIKNKKIGRIFQNNVKEMKLRHSRQVSCVINQTEMFQAVEQGDIKKLEDTINKGAEINGSDYLGWSSLHYAAKGGNLTAFKHVINLKVKNKFKTNYGESPLHIAVQYGQIEIVKWLVDNLKNPDVEDCFKRTPLFFAVFYNQKEIVKLLLSYDVQIPCRKLIQTAVLYNYKDVFEIVREYCTQKINYFEFNDKLTPLHIAAKNGYAEMTKYLIDVEKSDVNYCSNGEITPLFQAALYGHVETVKILLSNKADVNFANQSQATALHAAAQYGHDKVVQVLLENGADVRKIDVVKCTPLHLAASNGHLNTVKLLLKYKPDINAVTCKFETPLVFAADNGHSKVALYLLANKAIDLEQGGTQNSIVHFAAIHGDIELMNYILRRKGQMLKRNAASYSPLYLAALHGRLEIVKLLYERGANCLNSATDYGHSPLHACIHDGHLEVLKFFISQNVDLDVKTKELSSAISIASSNGNYEVVKLLGESGCDLNIKNAVGFTPLHLAIIKNHPKVVEYLLSKDVDIMALTKSKKFPIHIALECNQFNVAISLINKNKNLVNLKDDLNLTPLYIACRWNYTELVQLLINNGARIIYDDKHCMEPALSSGSKDVIDVLLKSGVDVHGRLPSGTPFLHQAVGFEQLDIVKMLVAKKVDINAFSTSKETALMYAAYFNFAEIADFLLKNKADPFLRNKNDHSALDITVITDSIDVFYLLFELFKVEVINGLSTESKLLYYAATYGREKIIRFLIEKGFNVNGRYKNGLTSLHSAARSNRRSIVNILLENGAYYDSENAENKKPIDLTEDELTVFSLQIIEDFFNYVKKGDYSGCLDCLRREAFVNAKSSTSLTPLHYACRNGFPDIVKLLLDFNADINMTADYGTPLVYAVLFDHYEITKILLKYGAVYNVPTKFSGNSLARLSNNSNITHLLELIDKVFDAIIKCDVSIIDEIKKINDLDILYCILSARNNDNHQLYLVAENSKFPEDKFAEICAHEVCLFVEKFSLSES